MITLETRMKIALSTLVAILIFPVYEVGCWLLNMPSNFSVLAGAVILCALFVLVPGIFYYLWIGKKDESEEKPVA